MKKWTEKVEWEKWKGKLEWESGVKCGMRKRVENKVRKWREQLEREREYD